MTEYNTLLLDQSQWDLVIDSYGNIAVATPPYSLSQDVASAIKLFYGELWYNTSKGVPYFENILGKFPSAQALNRYFEKAAMTVPGVKSVRCISFLDLSRKVTGELFFVSESGVKNVINF